VKNKFAVGDTLEIILPEGCQNIVLESMKDPHGEPISVAPGSGWEVRIPLPMLAGARVDHGLIARYL